MVSAFRRSWRADALMAHIWPTPNAKLVMDQRRATAPCVSHDNVCGVSHIGTDWFSDAHQAKSLNVESHGESWDRLSVGAHDCTDTYRASNADRPEGRMNLDSIAGPLQSAEWLVSSWRISSRDRRKRP